MSADPASVDSFFSETLMCSALLSCYPVLCNVDSWGFVPLLIIYIFGVTYRGLNLCIQPTNPYVCTSVDK